MIKEKIRNVLKSALLSLSIEVDEFEVEPPEDLKNGDYTSNAALCHAKLFKLNPVDLGNRIVSVVKQNLPEVKKIEVAGRGFLNFYLDEKLIYGNIETAIKDPQNYGRNDSKIDRKIIVEYTDPNPFKEFHVGHLMNNSVGESISRLIEFSGAETKRANYQGDLGLNVAKAIWGMIRLKDKMPSENDSISKRMAFISESYVLGSAGYDEAEAVKNDVEEINGKIFSGEDNHINSLYERGRKWSLESFEEIYKILGTKFDFYFFESQAAPIGEKIVELGVKQGIFEKSDGAVVFRGEKLGLHTRVFINSDGFPTYEGKELGLAKLKRQKYDFDESIVITAVEQFDYFKVVLAVIEQIFPEFKGKIKNITHGMMKLPSGKMSSRKGNVVSAQSLISALSGKVLQKMSDRKNMNEREQKRTAEKITVAAIKYSILKQSVGRDIVFDSKSALSFEGDSGPYLQYSAVRAESVLNHAKRVGMRPLILKYPAEIPDITRKIYRFPEIVLRAARELAPQYIATYLTDLCSEFNSYYDMNKIIDRDDEFSPFKLAITEAFLSVIRNGLWLMGISVPERM